MSDAAARFAHDLEALSSGRALAPESDAATLSIAGRLARAEFAVESRVKESLRARLLARSRRPALRRRPLWLFRLPTGLAGALVAAAIVLLLLRPRIPEPPAAAPAQLAPARPPAPRPTEALPALPGTFPVQKTARAPHLFRALPAGPIFATHRPADRLFVTAVGRRVVTATSRTVVWELEDEVFILEDRPIRIADVFFTPAL